MKQQGVNMTDFIQSTKQMYTQNIFGKGERENKHKGIYENERPLYESLHEVMKRNDSEWRFYPGLSQSNFLPRWLPAQADTSLISVGLLWQRKDPAMIPIWCLG